MKDIEYNIDKNKNKKIQIIVLIVMTVLLIGGVLIYNHIMFNDKADHDAEEEVSEDLPEAKIAMSEDELDDYMKSYLGNQDNSTDLSNTASGEVDTEIDAVEGNDSELDKVEDINQTIDFEGLETTNPDVYAWISIQGTSIEYPILQHPVDDTYYLMHNIDGSYGYPGCIYTEKANEKDFSSPNTLLYGHNMKNGSMFAGLHQYKDSDYFENNNIVNIYTEDKTYKYQIFAAYKYDDRHILKSFDFTNDEVYESYINNIFDRRDMNSVIDREVEVTADDHIITLSTCAKNDDDARFLVQAVLID